MTTPQITENEKENRIQALLAMPAMSVKVLWGLVVARGRGLNWCVGGALDGPYLGPEQAADLLH